MRTCLLALPLLWAPVASATAQAARSADRVAAAVDTNVLRAHLEFLADDALEGRRPGTRGGRLAARYIAAQFERLGLEPAGDSGTYYHRVPIITLTPIRSNVRRNAPCAVAKTPCASCSRSQSSTTMGRGGGAAAA